MSGRISMDELSKKLVASKKIMTKVDNGDFLKGNIDPAMTQSNDDDIPLMENPQIKQPIINESKINQSKLPEAIKRAMIENPIPQISLNDTLDLNFVEKTKRLMEQDGVMLPSQKPGLRKTTNQSVTPQQNLSDLESKLTPIIENIIRKVLDEKLTQILTAQQTMTINENLVLKVGNSIFQGKITKVKKSQ